MAYQLDAQAIGDSVAQAAETLVGSRFRLHGRDPLTGLDCVGVVEYALRKVSPAIRLPLDYELRSKDMNQYDAVAQELGLLATSGPIKPGDIVLLRVGPAQHPFAIAAQNGAFVHAHAGLRKVVCSPTLPDGALVAHWRFTSAN
jgi:cell wall-associated NlpC family hydrolase